MKPRSGLNVVEVNVVCEARETLSGSSLLDLLERGERENESQVMSWKVPKDVLFTRPIC